MADEMVTRREIYSGCKSLGEVVSRSCLTKIKKQYPSFKGSKPSLMHRQCRHQDLEITLSSIGWPGYEPV